MSSMSLWLGSVFGGVVLVQLVIGGVVGVVVEPFFSVSSVTVANCSSCCEANLGVSFIFFIWNIVKNVSENSRSEI